MKRILIVDDIALNIQILANILSNAGYEIDYSLSSNEALNMIIEDDYHLILLDIMMPELDGFTLCKEIKKIELKKDIPIIFITGKDDNESITNGFLIGGVDYITKPFNYQELIARVGTHVELFESRKQLENINNNLRSELALTKENADSLIGELGVIKKEIGQLDHSKNEFLSIIGHELRTPLNGIIGFTDLLKTMIPQNTEAMSFFDYLESSIKRLHALSITGLLITELNTNKDKQLEKIEFDLKDTIDEILFLKNRDSEPKVKCKFSIDGESVVYAHFTYMRTALERVLDNAFHYAGKNGQVEINLQSTKDSLSLFIKDTGPGFSSDYLNHNFQPFRPTDHIDNNKGLSLHLVSLIVEAHNGTIEAFNAPEGGAVINIILPK